MKKYASIIALLLCVTTSCNDSDIKRFAVGSISYGTKLVNNTLEVKGSVKIIGSQYYESGIVWGKKEKPTLKDGQARKLKRSKDSFDFLEKIPLEWDTTYYVTAYVKIGDEIRYEKYTKIVVPKKPAILLQAPVTGTKNVEYGVTISWNAVKDAEKYQVYLGKDSKNLSKTLEVAPTDKMLTTLLNVAFTHNSTYYWQVKATLKSGLIAESPVWHFITRDFSKILQSPAENANKIPLKAKFSWELNSKITYGYDVFLRKKEDKNFTKIASDLSAKSYTLTNAQKLTLNKNYLWYVVIKKGDTEVGRTATYNFSTGDKTPKKLLIPKDANRILGYAIDNDGNQYLLQDGMGKYDTTLVKMDSNNTIIKSIVIDKTREINGDLVYDSKSNKLHMLLSVSSNDKVKYDKKILDAGSGLKKSDIVITVDTNLGYIGHKYVLTPDLLDKPTLQDNGDIIGTIRLEKSLLFEGVMYNKKGLRDFILYKYDQNKNLIFKKHIYFNGRLTSYVDPYMDKNGNIYFLAIFRNGLGVPPTTRQEVFIDGKSIGFIEANQRTGFFKFDSAGAFQKVFYQNSGKGLTMGRKMVVDEDLNLYVLKKHDEDKTITIQGQRFNVKKNLLSITKYDANGKLVFFKPFSTFGPAISLSVKIIQNELYLFGRLGGINVKGYSRPAKSINAILIKLYKSNGNIAWADGPESTSSSNSLRNNCHNVVSFKGKIYMINYSNADDETKVGSKMIRAGGYVWQVR